MKINGTRTRLRALDRAEQVPIELTIAGDRVDAWLDHRGIHFRQAGSAAEGHLSWELAIALSLLPASWQGQGPGREQESLDC